MSGGLYARFKRPLFWPREMEAHKKWRLSLRVFPLFRIAPV